jgi:hypothetical protein
MDAPALRLAALMGWVDAAWRPPWWLRAIFRLAGDDGEVIVDNQAGDYLARFVVLHTRRFRLYLHILIQDDAGRDLHSHPFSFITVPLVRGYDEVRQKSTTRVRPFWPRLRTRSVWHRVTNIAPGRPAITAVLCWVADRSETGWGFQVDGELVPSQAYDRLGTKIRFSVSRSLRNLAPTL